MEILRVCREVSQNFSGNINPSQRQRSWDTYCRQLVHLQDLCLNSVDQARTNAYWLSYLLDEKTSFIQNHTLNSINFLISGWGFWTTRPRVILCAVPPSLEFWSPLLHSYIGSRVLSKYLYHVLMDFLCC